VRYAEDLDRELVGISRSAARLVRSGSTVLTYSHSTSVRLALWRAVAEGRRFAVACSESRPANEGVALARALADRGVPVHLMVDAALFGWLERASLVLVGADAVTAAGFANKIGTRPLLEAARRAGVPAYVLADSTKWLPAPVARFWRVRPESPGEIATLRRPDLTVDNRYFDTSPLSLAAGLVTADGVSRPASVRDRLRRAHVSTGLLRVLSASAPGGKIQPRTCLPSLEKSRKGS
jgi:translation initiation factor 2B subunit (eIF-2B alpha/beta/delta family)